MVAGFAELAERKDFFGCGGPIRTEYTIVEDTLPQRTDPSELLVTQGYQWIKLGGAPRRNGCREERTDGENY